MRYLKEYINPGVMAVLILCFFLPFVSIKCNGEMELAKKSGVQMAFGLKPESKMEGMMGLMGGGLTSDENFGMKERFDRPDVFSILTLLFLSLGIVFRFIPRTNKYFVFFILCLSASLTLVLMQIILYQVWSHEMKKIESELVSIKLTLHFAIGYWVVLIGSVLLAIINFISHRNQSFTIELEEESAQIE